MSKRETFVGDGSREIYLASTQAGQATSIALSTTQTGITLTNPLGSGKTLVLLQFTGAVTTVTASAAALTLTANVDANAAEAVHTTPLTVRRANLGAGGTGVGLADSAATLPAAPIVVRSYQLAVAASNITPAAIIDYIDGAIQVAPGCSVSINSVTTAVVGVWALIWEEIDEIS